MPKDKRRLGDDVIEAARVLGKRIESGFKIAGGLIAIAVFIALSIGGCN